VESPIKVVHLVLNLSVGGLERLLVEMLRFTDRQQVAPRVLCIEQEGGLAEQVRELGFEIESLDETPGRNFGLAWKLAQWFRAHRTQLVHTHGPYAHLYGALAGVLCRPMRIINTKHGFLLPPSSRNRLQSRLSARLSAQVVAVSDDLAKHLAMTEGLSSKKLRTIYNGIDPELYDAAPPVEADAPPSAAMIARLSAVKDVDTLLRATDQVRRQLPTFELRLIGDGPERGRLESLTDELGIRQNVQFLGTRHDISEQLHQVRAYVLSTHSEGMSISLLEAMACGLPTIATAVGGNPELVVDGVTGFLVDPGSADQLAQRLVWLMTKREEAEQMGAAGRKRVEERFDIRRTVRSYERLYRKVIGRDEPTATLAECEVS
jgi:glycosyltransferase involved in cell wall biosynthesis